MNKYRRLEFTFDIGQGARVLAFVAFSSHISFGIPKVYQFPDYAIEPKSENYERITVHKDGKVKTHFPLAQGLVPNWDGKQYPLAKWSSLWTMQEELDWSSRNPSMRNYLAKPKSRSDILSIPLIFPNMIEETKVKFAVIPSLGVNMSDIRIVAPEIEDARYCTWVLVDSWPYILISIEHPVMTPKCIQLESVGRNYSQ